MPIVHMIHGFVGAGKTTFSKKLEQEVRAVRFTPDEWICDLYGNNPPAENFDERQNCIYYMIRKMAERVLAAGADVILDTVSGESRNGQKHADGPKTLARTRSFTPCNVRIMSWKPASLRGRRRCRRGHCELMKTRSGCSGRSSRLSIP